MQGPREKTTARKSTEIAKSVRLTIKGLAEKSHQARAKGEPIAYLFVNSAYDDILRAMDIVTVGTENYAGVCAAKMDAERFLSKAEAEGYPRHLCTYATCGLGFDAMRRELGAMPPNAADGGMELPTVMLGTGMMICDPRYKWYQAAQRYIDSPVHILGLLNPPSYYTHVDAKELRDYYVRYVAKELREMVVFLERHTGRKLNWDRLSEVVDLSERTINVWHNAYELRKAVPAPMPTEDALNVMVPGYFQMGTPETYDFYRKLYEELKYRVDNKIGTIADEKYRLLWGLSLPPWYGLVIFNYFESKGAVFPIEVVYHPPPPVDIPPSVKDPIERMALRFYNAMTSHNQKARGHTGDPFVEWFLELIDEYKLDGVVMHQAMTCRTVHTGQVNQINLLKKYSDKPVLLLEGDIIDMSNYNEAATHDKVDAFIEMLEDQKKKR
ncbi:MAG: 2-hydroxyacyl-CoA dehydratase family protein [Chloroflexi bacterium]|nr:2-hydroxyacyl-CoA dehydratase family protein [Chloroflexota bacterium]